jgi:ketosteroid isomerase-like protein
MTALLLNEDAVMDAAWRDLRAKYEAAYAAVVQGNPEPFKAIWSRDSDVVLFGALDGFERGWDEIGPRFDWVSTQVVAEDVRVENLLTRIDGDLAVTVDFEHTLRIVEGKKIPRTLRVTQAYRRENGEWRIFHRHGSELRPVVGR